MTTDTNQIDGDPKAEGSIISNLSSQKLLGQFLVLVTPFLFLLIWHLIAAGTTPLILPSPYDVFMRLVSYFINGRVWPHLFMTTQEILAGFVLGSVLGIGFGTLVSESDIARKVIMPYIIVTQALPKFALAPMLVIWFGFGMAPKVIIAALIAFFPLVENTYMGLTTTPQPQLELFRALRASRITTLLKLRIPHAVPAIFSGFRVALMLSLVGAVVAEYVGANQGLGALIIVSQGTLDTELMFVAFVILTVLGLCLDWLYGLVYKIVLVKLYGKTIDDVSSSTTRLSV